MRISAVLPALVSLASALLPRSAINNGVEEKSMLVVNADQTLILDADWTNFTFTNVDVPVSPNFNFFTSPAISGLFVTDLYCAGDTFAIYNNGTFLMETSSPLFGADCQLRTANASLAFSQNYWSSATVPLASGFSYNITIVPTASPWSAGVAAIRWVSGRA